MDWIRHLRVFRQWRAHWGPKRAAVTVVFTVVLGFALLMYLPKKSQWTTTGYSGEGEECEFPAIFNFGDSNSDTGGKAAAFHRLVLPNGDTFFHKPSGRYCDGRVIIDFIAEKLGLPFLSAYLDSIGSDFRHGANFATGGSTVQPVDARICELGFSPISLDIQLLQFEQLKERTNELYKEAGSSHIRSRLPRPEEFSKALYTLDIGQNDLHAGLKSMTEKQLQESIPTIINHVAEAVEGLYRQGARTFWVHNTGPIGCLPYSLMHFPPQPDNMDQNGCIKSHNEVAKEYNQQLKERVSQLSSKLSDAIFTYVDIYSAKYALISEAKKHGFESPLGYCCGHYGNSSVQCGKKAVINGTEVFGASCRNPSVYISWDSVHYTEAANEWVAKHIIDCSFSDPPVPITKACIKHL